MQTLIPNPTHTIGRVNHAENALAQRYAQEHAQEQRAAHAVAYREQVAHWAARCAKTYIARSTFDCAHLVRELEAEAQSALGEALAVRIYRFPKLASDLLARFGCDALPSSTRRALRRTAFRAMDARMWRMSHDKALAPAHLAVFWADSPQPEGSAANDSQRRDSIDFVNARIDLLLRLVRERGTKNGHSARSATAHARLLEQARVYLLAAARGDDCATAPAAGLLVEGRLAKSALYFRLYRLGKFLGDDGAGMLGALRYAARR